MSDLTYAQPALVYSNLVTLNNPQNTGLTQVLTAIQDGKARSSPLEISLNKVNVNCSIGQFCLNNIPLTATANALNNAALGVVACGNTATRPVAPTAGTLYVNTDTNTVQGFTGTTWTP